MSDVYVFSVEDLAAEIFTYEEGFGEKRLFHFNVTRMWEYVHAWSRGEGDVALIPTVSPLPREWIENHLKPGGYEYEEARVAALTPEQIRVPLLGFEWEGGASVLVDGMHRMKRLYDDNAPEVRMILFPMELRERFAIKLPGRGTLDLKGPRWTNEQIEAFKKRLGVG